MDKLKKGCKAYIRVPACNYHFQIMIHKAKSYSFILIWGLFLYFYGAADNR